jgi:osmoprotectant transport system permease protein
MTLTAIPARPAAAIRLDKLGVLIAATIAAAFVFLPFVTARANRIVAGEAKSVFEALPLPEALLLVAIVGIALPIAFFKTATIVRMIYSFLALGVLFVLIGHAGTYLTPPGNTFAGVSPGSGCWFSLFPCCLPMP